MAGEMITGPQLKRLQTLWGLFCRQGRGLDARDREARLGWIGGAVGRSLGSCNELTRAEAKTAIDAIEKHLPGEAVQHRRPSKRLAQAYGTAGRKGNKEAEIRLIDADTWRLLDTLLGRLGWDRERLDRFLRSYKSPVPGGQLRTLAQANKVIWALKSFLRREEAQKVKSHAAKEAQEEIMAAQR